MTRQMRTAMALVRSQYIYVTQVQNVKPLKEKIWEKEET